VSRLVVRLTKSPYSMGTGGSFLRVTAAGVCRVYECLDLYLYSICMPSWNG